MRRKDRQLDDTRALHVLDTAEYAVLSLLDEEGLPYGVPISFVHTGGVLYFHGAFQGRKIAGMRKNPRVSLCAVGLHRVPPPILPREYKETKEAHGNIKPFLRDKFTTEYTSAVVDGHIEFVEDPAEKRRALRVFCEKYTPENEPYIDEAVETGLAYTNVWKLIPDAVTGKAKLLGTSQ